MEENKVDDTYMENLEEWILEEEKIVTYKFLSRSLKIHVNVAKQMLYHFVETKKSAHPDLGVVYLVSGLVKNKFEDDGGNDPYDQKVVIVKEEDLERTLKTFTTLLSQHIYSVQKNNSTVSVTSLFAVDKKNSDQDQMATAGLNSIKHKNAVPREGVKVPTIAKKEIKTEAVVKKEPSKKKTGGIQEAFSKTTKKASPEKSQKTKSSDVGTKPKNTGGIAGMFAKQANSKTKPKTTEEKENIVNQKIEADTSGSSKDNSPEKKEDVKPKKKTGNSGSKPSKSSGKKSSKVEDSKKRKRIQVMSESEEEEEEDRVEEKEEARVEEEAPPVASLIMSDEEEEEEDIPATPVQEAVKGKGATKGRRRVKKMVDKTYMDEQG